ncbi:protein mono-ADP-ribosyltransferase PARP11 [Protopterus annectens]|uniref:protein mono-ADP-ribosyltransferase PARP11 n=1 Tax=Protopterus annectens TaxID=7888 RepID=UPI001CFB1978|nr:protein mono-ADP-ribosyltransferase PARP11 [Protopterus annectens]
MELLENFRFTAFTDRNVLQDMQVLENKPEMEECTPEPMDTSEVQYNWFYLAECGQWHMFEMLEDITFRDREADPAGGCCIDSEEVEKRYLKNPRDSFTFFTQKFCYKLDFAEMKQTNLITGKQRPVKRAPPSATAVRYICDNRSIPLPQHWEQVDSDKPYKLIQLPRITNEYNEVASLFGRTMDPSRISCVHRIQNLDLWEFYCRKKAQLMKIRGVSDIREEMLFHGTSFEFVDAICCSNFDWRLNGANGTAYGKGKAARHLINTIYQRLKTTIVSKT